MRHYEHYADIGISHTRLATPNGSTAMTECRTTLAISHTAKRNLLLNSVLPSFPVSLTLTRISETQPLTSGDGHRRSVTTRNGSCGLLQGLRRLPIISWALTLLTLLQKKKPQLNRPAKFRYWSLSWKTHLFN